MSGGGDGAMVALAVVSGLVSGLVVAVSMVWRRVALSADDCAVPSAVDMVSGSNHLPMEGDDGVSEEITIMDQPPERKRCLFTVHCYSVPGGN